MPMYTYVCGDCKSKTTKIISIDARDQQVCHCGTELTRQIDRPGLVWAPTAGGMR